MAFKFIFFIVLVIFNSVLTLNPEKLMKKAKVGSCLALANAIITKDKEMFERIASTLNAKSENKKMGGEGVDQLFQIILINCYQSINDDQVQEILKDVQNKNLNPFDPQYQSLLGIGKTVDKDSFDFNEYTKTLKEVNELLQEIKDDEKELMDKLRKEYGDNIPGAGSSTSSSKEKKKESKSNKKSTPSKPAYPNEKWQEYKFNDSHKGLNGIINGLGLTTFSGLIIISLLIIGFGGKNVELLKKAGIIQKGMSQSEYENLNKKNINREGNQTKETD